MGDSEQFREHIELSDIDVNPGTKEGAQVLYRVGPSIWLSFQIITWGLVATLQSLQHGEDLVNDCQRTIERGPNTLRY